MSKPDGNHYFDWHQEDTMKLHCSLTALCAVVCLLVVHEADAWRRQTYRRRTVGWIKPISIASIICQKIFDVQASCGSCNCQAPHSQRCKSLCAIRDEIRECATDALCPPSISTTTTTEEPTTESTETSTEVSTSTTTEGMFSKFLYSLTSHVQ